MTVVAYRDGILASDSRCTSKFFLESDRVKKIFRLPDSSLVGIAGTWRNAQALIEQLKAIAKTQNKTLPNTKYRDVEALHISKSGQVRYYSRGGWDDIRSGYYAIGCAYEIAFGVLDSGGSAAEAVKAAIKRNIMCGGRVQKLEL